MHASPASQRRGSRAPRRLPRGLLASTAAALGLSWGLFALDPGGWPGIASPLAQSAGYLALAAIMVRSRRAKVALVRSVQRFTVNPLLRLLLRPGVNPLGLAVLETRGRVSDRPRRTPVGNGRLGDTFWIIAEHGERAGYFRNIRRDPRVRVRLRVGWRYRWVPGSAEVLPDDDALGAGGASSAGTPCARSTRSTSASSAPTCSPCGSDSTCPGTRRHARAQQPPWRPLLGCARN